MEIDPGQVARLARRLGELRKSAGLTQAELARTFSAESRITAATISSWESANNPKTPPAVRLNAYARFFATERSMTGGLLSEGELTDDEHRKFRELETELTGLTNTSERPGTFVFDDGPVIVVCPDAPESARGPLARPEDPNFSLLHRYGDPDSLIEVFGHLRASNPSLHVFYRLASEVRADDLSTHVIVLGGIAWNEVTQQIQDTVREVIPIEQVDDPDLHTGEPFVADGVRFDPTWSEPDEGGNRRLREDVALLASLPNPFNSNRWLIICNGIHSRGVLGAVRCLTDHRVREANERYLAERFPKGTFALLLKVRIVANEAISPDLQNADVRLYEWPPA